MEDHLVKLFSNSVILLEFSAQLKLQSTKTEDQFSKLVAMAVQGIAKIGDFRIEQLHAILQVRLSIGYISIELAKLLKGKIHGD